MGDSIKAWLIAPAGTGVEEDVKSITRLFEAVAPGDQPQRVADAEGFVSEAAIEHALWGDLELQAHQGARLVWVVGDAKRKNGVHQLKTEGLSGYYPLSGIWNAVVEAASRHPEAPLIFIIDACHAGAPPGFSPPPSLLIFAACQFDEKTIARDGQGGWLSQQLVEGLLSRETAADLHRRLSQSAPSSQRPYMALGKHGGWTLGTPSPSTSNPRQLKAYAKPGPLPARPYPLLGPYEDPRLLFGRDADIDLICALVERSGRPIVGLHAASGVGKTSVLRAGVVPRLGPKRPVAYTTAGDLASGVLARLSGLLFEDASSITTVPNFLDLLRNARTQADVPVLIIDQFEELLGTPTLLAALGTIMDATVAALDRPCVWLIAYRSDFHGDVEAWLDARGLRTRDRYESQPLHAFGRQDPTAFFDAIYKPLQLPDHPWRWQIDIEDARRLGNAFAAARAEHSTDPLVPQLQCVLQRYMLADVAQIRIPTQVGETIDAALAEHLETALEYAVMRAGRKGSTKRREGTLIALKQLVVDHKRGPALPTATLKYFVGEDAESVLKRLEGANSRVLLPNADRTLWRLSHDRLAPIIEDAAARPGQELCELDDFIERRVRLHARADSGATVLGFKRYRKLRRSSLVDMPGRAQWWAACQARWRRIGRWSAAGLVVLAIATVLGTALWRHSQREAQLDDRLINAAKNPDQALLSLCVRVEAEEMTAIDAAARLTRKAKLDVAWLTANPTGCAQMDALRLALLHRLLVGKRGIQDLGILLSIALDLRRSADSTIRVAATEAWAALAARLKEVVPGPRPELDWIDISAGHFEMGCEKEGCDSDEQPLRSVTVGAFKLARTEVTCAEYRHFQPAYRCRWGANGPLTGLNWFGALAFAAWMDAELPTEAQWEYAARAGTTTRWPHGDDEAGVDAQVWHLGNARRQPQIVATRAPNPWGLHDMHGNVWEWVADRYASRYDAEDVADPAGPSTGAGRVMRGGSAWLTAVYCRSAYRGRGSPSSRSRNVGFRLARPASPPSSVLDH